MNTPATEPKPKTVRGNFVAFLTKKNEGVTTDELDEELAQLVREVNETGRSGKLTYTIEVSKKNKRGIVVTDDLKITKPKRQKETSYFYADESGLLLRNDPNQREMDFKVAESDEPAAAKTKVANA